MRHSKILQKLFYVLIVLGLAACSSGSKLPYAIEKAKIQDDFDMTITDKVVTVKAGELFSLAQLGLEASKKPWKWNAKDTPNKFRDLSDNKYPFYDVTIKKRSYGIYYGRLMFFNLASDEKAKAFARAYYQIKIPSRLFEEGKGGRIACANDAEKPTGKKASKKSLEPTWIIWLSDSPL